MQYVAIFKGRKIFKVPYANIWEIVVTSAVTAQSNNRNCFPNLNTLFAGFART